MTIFIDASVICAYANFEDVHHQKAVSIMHDVVLQKYGTSVTTDYIFDEVLSVISRKIDKEAAIEIANLILQSEILLAYIGPLITQKAWLLFQTDNCFSFTDCTCVAFMEMMGITHIATFDKEFTKQTEITVVGV